MEGKTPLRRRRMAGISGSIHIGGNPNEPDSHPAEHDEGVAGSSSTSAAAAAAAAAAPTLPLHRQIVTGRYMNDDAIISTLEEERHRHGAHTIDIGTDETKIHDETFASTLRRQISRSMHSGMSFFGRDTAYKADNLVPARADGGRLQHSCLSILDRAIERRDWRAVVSIVSAPSGPSLASRRSHAPLFYGGQFGTTLLPLHRACMYSPPVYAIEALLRANADAASSVESTFHRLPLHLACRSGSASVETIRALLLPSVSDLNGLGAVRCQDKLGRVPIHYCLGNGANPSIVEDLVTAYPASLDISDNLGWKPIHVACGSGADLAIVEYLAKTNPSAIGSTTRWGSRPQDIARMFVGHDYADCADSIFIRDWHVAAIELGKEAEQKGEQTTKQLVRIDEEHFWKGDQARQKQRRPASRFARSYM